MSEQELDLETESTEAVHPRYAGLVRRIGFPQCDSSCTFPREFQLRNCDCRIRYWPKQAAPLIHANDSGRMTGHSKGILP